MFWVIVERAGVLLMTAIAGKQLVDALGQKIKPDRVYSTNDAAKLLQIEKADVIELILTGKLKAQSISGNYRILGKNLMEMLSGKKHAFFEEKKEELSSQE